MMPIQTTVNCLGAESPYQLVLNPYIEMNGLATRMMRFTSYYDVDVSGFDLTVPKVILDDVAAFNKWFTTARQALSNLFDSFFLMVLSSPVIAGKALMSRHGGVPSGSMCTSLIDSQCLQLIFFLAAGQMYGYDLSPAEYYYIAWTYSTGDDTILASDDPMITGQVVADFARDTLLMEVIDASKNSQVTANPITEILYALRQFIRLAGHTNVFSGALKRGSISLALCWSETTDPVIITDVVKCAMNEVALHNKDDYERLCGMISKSGLPINHVLYSTFMADLADQVLTATSKQNIKPTLLNMMKSKTKTKLVL